MICQYCKKTLSTKSNLLFHQKTVKYCLKYKKNIRRTNIRRTNIRRKKEQRFINNKTRS